MNEDITEHARASSSSAKAVAEALFRQKHVLISTVAIIMAITLALTFLTPKLYKSEMNILVQNKRTDLLIGPEKSTGSSAPSDVTEERINSEIEVLRSKDVADAVIDPGWQQVNLKDHTDAEIRRHDKAVENYVKHVSFELLHRSNVIHVTYIASSPREATDTLNALLNAFFAKHHELERPSGIYGFFNSEAERYKRELDVAEGQLAGFQQSRQLVTLTDKEAALQSQITELQGLIRATDVQAAEVSNRLSNSEGQLDTIPQRLATQQRLIPNTISIEQLTTTLTELRNKRIAALTKFPATDRSVEELDKQIANTSDALQSSNLAHSFENTTDVNPLWQQVKGAASSASTELQALRARRSNEGAQLARLQALLVEIEGGTVDFTTLQQRVTELQGNYELYSQKRNEAQIADAMDQQQLVNVAVAERPTFSAIAFKPQPVLNLAMGSFTALFFAACIVFFAEMGRDTIAAPYELEAISVHPVLATVPFVPDLRVGRREPPPLRTVREAFYPIAPPEPLGSPEPFESPKPDSPRESLEPFVPPPPPNSNPGDAPGAGGGSFTAPSFTAPSFIDRRGFATPPLPRRDYVMSTLAAAAEMPSGAVPPLQAKAPRMAAYVVTESLNEHQDAASVLGDAFLASLSSSPETLYQPLPSSAGRGRLSERDFLSLQASPEIVPGPALGTEGRQVSSNPTGPIHAARPGTSLGQLKSATAAQVPAESTFFTSAQIIPSPSMPVRLRPVQPPSASLSEPADPSLKFSPGTARPFSGTRPVPLARTADQTSSAQQLRPVFTLTFASSPTSGPRVRQMRDQTSSSGFTSLPASRRESVVRSNALGARQSSLPSAYQPQPVRSTPSLSISDVARQVPRIPIPPSQISLNEAPPNDLPSTREALRPLSAASRTRPNGARWIEQTSESSLPGEIVSFHRPRHILPLRQMLEQQLQASTQEAPIFPQPSRLQAPFAVARPLHPQTWPHRLSEDPHGDLEPVRPVFHPFLPSNEIEEAQQSEGSQAIPFRQRLQTAAVGNTFSSADQTDVDPALGAPRQPARLLRSFLADPYTSPSANDLSDSASDLLGRLADEPHDPAPARMLPSSSSAARIALRALGADVSPAALPHLSSKLPFESYVPAPRLTHRYAAAREVPTYSRAASPRMSSNSGFSIERDRSFQPVQERSFDSTYSLAEEPASGEKTRSDEVFRDEPSTRPSRPSTRPTFARDLTPATARSSSNILRPRNKAEQSYARNGKAAYVTYTVNSRD